VVFELMSWREGFFSFEERGVDDAPAEATIQISTESLLMEGARRIDEWSRIADKVPHLGVVPVLAPVHDDHPSLLDLLPNEWAVLALIDGQLDLRGIAHTLAQSEFDIAKIAYGLVSTGVIELKNPDRTSGGVRLAAHETQPHVERANALLKAGKLDEALSAARSGIVANPSSAEARLAAARTLGRLGRWTESVEELRRALRLDPLSAEIHRELGFAAVRKGDLTTALASWEQYLRLAPDGAQAAEVRRARDSALQLHSLMEAHAGV
jgi:tetratricopeptide (TPR) repeat protein